jgi:hypothetical protein
VIDTATPSWELYQDLLARSRRTELYKAAADWALTELATTLDDDWLRRAAKAERPPPLLSHLGLVASHTQALAETLEWALRLRLVRDLPGAAKLRRDLVRDPTEGRSLHTALQLAIAGSAVRLDWAVVLEPNTDGAKPPADLAITGASGTLVVEARVLTDALGARESRARIDEATDRLLFIGMEHDAWIGGRLGRCLLDHELEDLRDRVARWAEGSRAAEEWTADSVELIIERRDVAKTKLASPAVRDELWPRMADAIRAKAVRMADSGSSWLRMIPLTGLWVFTEWAREPLEVKLQAAASALAATLGSAAPSGVVLSSAAALYPGDVNEERAQYGPAVAVRCAVRPLRARETMVIPLRPEAIDAVRDWVALADAETDWLEWALAGAGLPSLEELLASQL